MDSIWLALTSALAFAAIGQKPIFNMGTLVRRNGLVSAEDAASQLIGTAVPLKIQLWRAMRQI